MKKHCKIFALCLALLLALTLVCGLAACTDDTTEPDEPQTPTEPLVLVDTTTGEGIYAVVRPEISERRLIDQAASLRTKLLNYFGAEKWEILTDWEKDPDPAEIATRYEILVGKTSRPESDLVYDALEEGEYTIRVVGNKLVVLGKTDELTAFAVDAFKN